MSADPIEDYLDLLYAKLRAAPRDARRILAEAEDHLREGVAGGIAAGLTEREAQEAAISSFGSVRAVVRAHDRLQRFPALAVLRDLAGVSWLLGSLGLLAVGVSGLIAAAMNTVLGRGFVGGVPASARFSAVACQHWLALWPGARSCAQAAMLENSSDAVSLRLLGGIVGLVLLAGYYLAWLIRRGRPPRSLAGRTGDWLPDGFVPAAGVCLFGVAGLGLTWLAVTGTVVGGSPGAGYYLSGAIVALAASAAFVPALRRTRLRQARG